MNTATVQVNGHVRKRGDVQNAATRAAQALFEITGEHPEVITVPEKRGGRFGIRITNLSDDKARAGTSEMLNRLDDDRYLAGMLKQLNATAYRDGKHLSFLRWLP